MLLTITLTQSPELEYSASDLGFLLHKHPDHHQHYELSHGVAHIFYPEVSERLCQAALWVDIDPIHLVRTFRGTARQERSLKQYVNDRPYVANSFLSVAIAKVLGSALNGSSKERQALADSDLPFEINIPVLPSRGGEKLLRDLFEPLGYELTIERLPLDPQFSEWGDSPYYSVTLNNKCKLSSLLSHLYVLIPVLDNDKHYWVSDSEIEKLQRHGEVWLGNHPKSELIVRRYMKGQAGLARRTMASLDLEDSRENKEIDSDEEELEKKISLNEQRLSSVLDIVKSSDASTIIDLGCGEGRLLHRLLQVKRLNKIVGMDVSTRCLERSEQRLKLEQKPEKIRDKVSLIQGALHYRDKRLQGFDIATCIEVIEHMDEDRLDAFEKVLFQHAQPSIVVITTPNVEYNVKFDNLTEGKLRHGDHRFEWDRMTFQSWANRIASEFGYKVQHDNIGEIDTLVGSATQMATFSRAA